MKVGMARQWKGLEGVDFLNYDAIWAMLRDVTPTGTRPSGEGTLEAPFAPLGIGDWYWLSQRPIADPAMFMSIGGRLIVRWGALAQGMKNYASDVTDLPRSDLADPAKQKDAIGAVKKGTDESDTKAQIPTTGITVYARKALRVAKLPPVEAASRARELMWGVGTGDPADAELANSLAGLLVCESNPSRDKGGAIFITTMLLLDLVQAGIRYGHKDQYYSWTSMLMHGDPDRKNPVPLKVEGRGISKDPRTVAKHPMAGAGTVDMGKSLTNMGKDNAARNRAVSVASAWLANYMAESDPQRLWRFMMVRQTEKAVLGGKTAAPKTYKNLRAEAELCLRTRSVSTTCLLTGSRTKEVEYVELPLKVQ